jgi:hypothetical protein
VRYFIDVEIPLLFVAHGRQALVLSKTALDAALIRVRGANMAIAGVPPGARDVRRTGRRVLLGIGYALVLVPIGLQLQKDYSESVVAHARLATLAPNSLVLAEFNLQYGLLYARPDLRVVPSSEIGFPRRDIQAEYLAFFNLGRVCGLSRRIHADYFIESRGMYLDPRDTACLSLVREDAEQRIWRFIQ